MFTTFRLLLERFRIKTVGTINSWLHISYSEDPCRAIKKFLSSGNIPSMRIDVNTEGGAMMKGSILEEFCLQVISLVEIKGLIILSAISGVFRTIYNISNRLNDENAIRKRTKDSAAM